MLAYQEAYAFTSALIMLSDNDRGIVALIVKKKQLIYGNQTLGHMYRFYPCNLKSLAPTVMPGERL